MSDRRTFLRGLVSLPLIGGGVTLIGRPATAVPLIQAAALPTLDDPRQRARYAWKAFSGAMRELTAGDQGWLVHGYERAPHGVRSGGDWMQSWAITYGPDDPSFPRRPYVEHHRQLDI